MAPLWHLEDSMWSLLSTFQQCIRLTIKLRGNRALLSEQLTRVGSELMTTQLHTENSNLHDRTSATPGWTFFRKIKRSSTPNHHHLFAARLKMISCICFLGLIQCFIYNHTEQAYFLLENRRNLSPGWLMSLPPRLGLVFFIYNSSFRNSKTPQRTNTEPSASGVCDGKTSPHRISLENFWSQLLDLGRGT